MRTLSLLGCLIMVAFGLYYAMTKDFVAGSIVLIVGGLAFVIIIHTHKDRIKEHKRTFMDW